MADDSIETVLDQTRSYSKQSFSCVNDINEQSRLLSAILLNIQKLSESSNPGLMVLSLDVNFLKDLRNFFLSREKEIRIAGIKVLRYLLISKESAEAFKKAQFIQFIIRAFEGEGKSPERIEACKLMKKWMELHPKSLPKAFINSLVSLAECEADELREFAIEGLRVLSISITHLIALSGGFRVLINSILDTKSTQPLCENVIWTFLYLLNEPRTRMYLRRDLELGRILAVFTDHDSGMRESDQESLFKLARKALVFMSRSWGGLFYLASNGLKDVIECLRQPCKANVKEAILDTIMEFLNISTDTSIRTLNLLNNYVAMLLLALLHCNLFQALTHLAMDKEDRLAQRARKLLKLVTKSAADLLPEAPQFPLMLDTTSASKAAELVADIDSAARLKSVNNNKTLLSSACEFVSFESMGGVSSANWVLQGIYKQHALNAIDDNVFMQLLNKSNVNKDVTKWDWDIIYEILAGPIYTPSRFSSAVKSKFLKNLLGYYLPSKRYFHDLQWHPQHFIKARIGCLLTSLLLSHEDGINLLTTTSSENFFISRKSYMGELVDAIDEEVKALETERSTVGRLFTPELMRGYMVREYFKWIGQLTGNRQGRKLLVSYELNTKLLKLAPVEHLSPVLIPHLDYKEQTSRDFLSCALQGGSLLVRKHAMEQLRVLFRAGIYDLSWAVRDLVTQLYSPDADAVSSSLDVLDELCQDKENLKACIEAGPQVLTRLGDRGNKCLIHFLSSSSGVEYLSNFEFIDSELEKWKIKGNLDYVKLIEQRIESGLSSTRKNYALTLPVPAAYQHFQTLEVAWIRKLPFTLTCFISGDSKELTKSLDIMIELDNNEVNMIGRLYSQNSITGSDVISVCLLLGNCCITNRGQESTEPDWIRCTREDRAREAGSIREGLINVEKDGVIFELKVVNKHEYVLQSICYRMEVIPRYAPRTIIPHHLYGELVKTKLGLRKLQSSGHVDELIQNLQGDTSVIKKREALWALGHAGCSDRGITYINKLGAVKLMIQIAEKSPVLSLRGTAFQALSLLARSQDGRNILYKYGWASPESINATIALPLQPSKIFWLEKDTKIDLFQDEWDMLDEVVNNTPMNEEEREVYKHVIGLGNLANRMESDQFIRSKRSQKPAVFESVGLFSAVMESIAGYGFRLQGRRIIHKFFEKIYKVQNFMSEYDKMPKLAL